MKIPVYAVTAFPPRFVVSMNMKSLDFVNYGNPEQMSLFIPVLGIGRYMEKRTKAWHIYEELAKEVFGR